MANVELIPATTGHLETRALIQTQNMEKRETQVVLGETREGEKLKGENKSITSLYKNCLCTALQIVSYSLL